MSDKTKPLLLIVDDSPENIEILRNILAGDYVIKVATNGETALQICSHKDKPDLILLDIIMPGLNGYEVCKILKNQHTTCDIPIVIISAKNKTDDEIKGLNFGALDYISRPFEPEIVKMRVRNILALVEANKLKEDINNILKHDVRTPLTVILLNARDSLNSLDDKENIAYNLKNIIECAQNINSMMNASLELYKIERGVFNFYPKKIDLKDVVEKAIDSMIKIAEIKQIKIKLCSLKDYYKISGDMLLIHSVILNLIKNAVEASPENKTIEINASSFEKGKILLSITNCGTIPAEIRNEIFKKYVTFGKTKGSGLGLYSARLMVEVMNGTISFETDDEKGQTKFNILLNEYI
ncbi:response regulator [Candidatus Dependentiae bacterium]|nr:response regulator [Candidatus Dependentiae bacterium]